MEILILHGKFLHGKFLPRNPLPLTTPSPPENILPENVSILPNNE